MSRNDLTKHFRSRTGRVRAIWLSLAVTGLATAAFAAVDFSPAPDRSAMGHTITRQRVAAGQPANAAARQKQDAAYTPDQILAAAATYEEDMTKALEHGENLRLHAYRSRDIIRMTCVDERLGQMKEIMAIARPRFMTIRTVVGDELSLRSQFTTIREGWERITQLTADMEQCIGEGLDSVTAARIPSEETGPGAAIDDPTLPPDPTSIAERPSYASPFR